MLLPKVNNHKFSGHTRKSTLKKRGGRMMKAKVNEGCISCGACVSTCPEVFRFNDEELAEAYADVTEETKEAAEEARDSCPVSVIDLME
ncbi:MAG: ferredoxin [Ruminococcus sp.]|nr:ferredoxin [Ruminococcus sp.]